MEEDNLEKMFHRTRAWIVPANAERGMGGCALV